MFDERMFVTRKQQQWQDLTVILERAKIQGLKALPPTDLARLGSLYRRTAADLAYSRTQHATQELVFYLNELVGQGHGILYQHTSEATPANAVLDFFRYDFPAVMRKRMPFVAAAFLITLLAIFIAYRMVLDNPADSKFFISADMQDSVDAWKKGFADNGTISAGEGAAFAAFLMTHNLSVGIGAFVTGMTVIMPPYLLFENGAMMGALIAEVKPTGYLVSMWAGLLPHGICELGAIFICGGAGMLLAWSFIAPGPYRRRDALLLNAKDAVKMVIGTIPMFIIAGIIEGNVSHSALPHFLKFSLAAVQLIGLGFYIYGAKDDRVVAA